MQHDILIIGGGLAGLACAIHLSREGRQVTLVEKESYPHHKVCGEYVSNEVLPYLEWLDIQVAPLSIPITKLDFSLPGGQTLSANLPLGGFGLSRYAFDQLLYRKALASGCTILKDQVTGVDYSKDRFTVTTAAGDVLGADVVLCAYGKRSLLDVKLKRSFIGQAAPWLAVKSHYKGAHPKGTVGLHCFDGGYCGVSEVENGELNICYLTTFESFKKYKDIDAHREAVLCRNPVLKKVFEQAAPLFEKPLTISQVSFERKKAVEGHMLMIGDAAGLIHPLCGNGMAMAIHSAKIASEAVQAFTGGNSSRAEMETFYTRQWNRHFRGRIRMGKLLAGLLRHKSGSLLSAGVLKTFPSLLPVLIRTTHGKPIKPLPA